MAPVVSPTNASTQSKPCVLVVDDEPGLAELVADVAEPLHYRFFIAETVAEARQILASQPIQVLVADVHLPDGDGLSLLQVLQQRRPSGRALVITGKPSLEIAVTALRNGAVDFIAKPFSNDNLLSRLRQAVDDEARAAKTERKVDRLKAAVRRLNDARRVISKKVDLLCNDLVSAYGELSRQLDIVRVEEGFRKYVADAKDLEQLLCHAMDWLLRQIGYSNVALWLAGEDGQFQLGAYMKYTVPGELLVTDALRREVLPASPPDGVLRMRGSELCDRLTPAEYKHLRGNEILSLNCTYLGETLAALVFFRSEQTPFTEEDESLLKAIGPVFAVLLAGIVRETPDDPPGGNGSDDHGNVKDPDDRKRPDKRDAADWWKRGESPPF